MASAPRARPLLLVATAAAVLCSSLVLALYIGRAASLVAYPWDWSPDEGLYLDHARRLVDRTAPLHPRSFVPFPSAYGPLLPLSLAPAVALLAQPLAGARVLALAWALAGALAVFVLARRGAPPALALAAAALALAPFDLSFWHLLVRPDGPMLALLLLAALPLLPRRLERGSDRLSTARLAAGTALLLAAVLAKPTGAVHGAPLVLAWLLVDRRSAVRLALALGAAGLAALLALQWATGGGFLWVQRVWGYHEAQAGLPGVIASVFLARAWPLLLACALALASTGRGGRDALRDGGVVLLLAAAAVLPLTRKYGASWNYLVPSLPALAVLAARWWAKGADGRALRAAAGAASLGAIALALALTREFPLPSPEDARTAGALYGFVREHTSETGGPILAVRPELAYFVVGQPVEMEGSGFRSLARGGAPGTEVVLERLREARYSLVVLTWPLPDAGGYEEALARSYGLAGGCKLGYYFGEVTVNLLPRRDAFRPMRPLAGTRCGSAPGPTRTAGLAPPREKA
jgi:hypothetical protein